MLTVLKYTLLLAIVLSGLWLLMLPVYVWILHRDAMLAPQRGSVPARPGPPAVVMALSSTVHESVEEVFFSICW